MDIIFKFTAYALMVFGGFFTIFGLYGFLQSFDTGVILGLLTLGFLPLLIGYIIRKKHINKAFEEKTE